MLSNSKVGIRLAYNGSLVPVLEISTNSGEVDNYRNIELLQLSPRADTAQL